MAPVPFNFAGSADRSLASFPLGRSWLARPRPGVRPKTRRLDGGLASALSHQGRAPENFFFLPGLGVRFVMNQVELVIGTLSIQSYKLDFSSSSIHTQVSTRGIQCQDSDSPLVSEIDEPTRRSCVCR